MSEKTDQEEVDTQGQAVVQSPEQSEMPPWFKPFADKVDGKFGQFGKDLGRLRDKIRDKPPAEAEGQQTQTPAQEVDVQAVALMAQDLGRARANLPETADKMIADMLDDGASIQDALRMAKLAQAMAPANGASPKSPAEPRRQAPTQKAPQHPRSVQEFMDLQRKANAKDQAAMAQVEALMQDDTFDLNRLPQYTR